MSRLRRWARSLRRPVFPYLRNVNQRFHSRNRRRSFNPGGIDVFDEDWDTLILLDGCRYDFFDRYSDLPGDFTTRESRGSMTVEFLRGNVAGRTLHDTVYVTGNGQFYNHRDELDASFHHVENLWRLDDAWDDHHYTVFPEPTVEYALRAAEHFPDKRLLVHFVQPHYPFIDAPIEMGNTFEQGTPDFWNRVARGELEYDPAELRQAHVRNLQAVLPHVATLLDKLEGKTVVTSDHGNLLGERAFPIPVREWGHPPSLWLPLLTTVPWLVYEHGTRREIVADEPTTDETLANESAISEGDDHGVEEHLRHLGYR